MRTTQFRRVVVNAEEANKLAHEYQILRERKIDLLLGLRRSRREMARYIRSRLCILAELHPRVGWCSNAGTLVVFECAQRHTGTDVSSFGLEFKRRVAARFPCLASNRGVGFFGQCVGAGSSQARG